MKAFSSLGPTPVRLVREAVRRVRASPYGSSISAILGANVAMQAISFMSVPILTRLYGPEFYGLFALFISASSYVTLFGLLRYDAAVDVADDDREARALILICGGLMAISVTLASIAVVFFHRQVAEVLGSVGLADLLPLLPVFVAAGGSATIVQLWFVRQRDFKTPSNLRVGNGILDSLIKVLLGLGGLIKYGQTLGSVLATSAMALVSIALGLRRGIWTGKRFELHHTLSVFRKYRQFPMIAFPATLLEWAASQLPLYFIAHYFGPKELGLYYIAMRVTQLPSLTFATAIRPVFKRYAAIQMQAGEGCRLLVVRTVGMSALIGIPIFTILIVFAHPITTIWLGDDWSSAADLVQILGFLWLFDLLINPITPVFLVMGAQKLNLMIQGLLTALTVGAFVIGGAIFHDFQLAMLLYVGAFALKYLAEFVVCYRLSGRDLAMAPGPRA